LIKSVWKIVCKASHWCANTWLGKFLGKTEVPIWLLAATWIAAAVSTYHFSPKLNAKFEQNRMISQATLEQVKSINSGNKELLQSLSKILSEVQTQKKPSDKTKADIVSQIIALQFQAIELKAMDPEDKDKIIEEYQKTLTKLSVKVSGLKEGTQVDELKLAIEDYVFQSAILTGSRLR